MQIFKTSYNDKKINRLINEAVGESYSFAERWKLRGIGSKRLVVSAASSDFEVARNPEHYQTVVSIELRPKGLLVYFRKKIDNYTAVFPFHKLVINKTNDVQLQLGNASITFADGYVKDKLFFDKVRKDDESMNLFYL